MDPKATSGQLPISYTGNKQLAMYQHRHPALDDHHELDLRQYWEVIWKHKLTIIIFTFIVLAATTISTSLQPPIYRSTLTMQIDRANNMALNPEMMMYSDWYSADFYETQYQLIKSTAVAERVARDMGLTSSERFKPQKQGSFFSDITQSIRSYVYGEDESAVNSASSDISGQQRPEQFAGMLASGLTVVPVKNSRLVRLSFDSQSPQFAADAVNSYAKNFMEMNLEKRVSDSSYAQTFLAEQIKQVRANLEDSERRLVEYAKNKNIADLDNRLSHLLEQLRILNKKLLDIEAKRIEAQAGHEEIQKGKGIHGIAKVTDNPLVQAYKESLGKLEAEYSEKLNVYKPAYPEMQKLKGQIDSLKKKLQEEASNIYQSLLLEYKSFGREETLLKQRIEQINQQVLDLRNRTTDYQALKRDVDTNVILYDSLLQQTKEVSVAAGISANNMSIVDAGRVPASPFKPDLQKNLTIALMLGLLGGIGLALLFDKLDDTVKSGPHLEQLTGLAVLGIVPNVDKKVEGISSVGMLTRDDPKSPVAEAYRSFRTALSLSTVGGHPPILHITSSGVGEGKTTTALGAAMTFIQAGARVLLVDADLRNPSIHKELNLSNNKGLTSFLAGEFRLGQVMHKSKVIDGLWVIPAGPIPPNPAELLASSKMQEFLGTAEEQFDVVIVDSPPVLGLADALVLSNMSRATVLVADAGTTRKGVLNDTMKRLHGVQANVIGTILTKFNQGNSSYRYLYSYYGVSKDDKQKKLAS